MCESNELKRDITEAVAEPDCAAPMPRRSALATLGALLVALVTLPSSLVRAKKIGLDLSKAADLSAPGTSKLIKYKDTEILLVRDRHDAVHAINNTCTHKKCKVAFKASSDNLFCKCHKSAFKLDGTVVAGPAPRPLTTYPAVMRNNKIIVDVP